MWPYQVTASVYVPQVLGRTFSPDNDLLNGTSLDVAIAQVASRGEHYYGSVMHGVGHIGRRRNDFRGIERISGGVKRSIAVKAFHHAVQL